MSLVRDVYPAEVVEVGGKVWTKARVFVTTERFIVYALQRTIITKVVDLPLGEPGRVQPQQGALTAPLEVATLTRGFIVNQGRGCRCHSALLALSPPEPW